MLIDSSVAYKQKGKIILFTVLQYSLMFLHKLISLCTLICHSDMVSQLISGAPMISLPSPYLYIGLLKLVLGVIIYSMNTWYSWNFNFCLKIHKSNHEICIDLNTMSIYTSVCLEHINKTNNLKFYSSLKVRGD